MLDAGTSGIIVVAATDVEERVEAAIQRGKDIVKKQVQIDADGLKTEIDCSDRRVRPASRGEAPAAPVPPGATKRI